MSIQGELPIEEPETPETDRKATEADVIDALERRYSATAGNGRRYATAYGVRSHAGFDARRTADFVAMDLWPSGGLRLHGHEVKVSRSDWLRELKAPEKAAEFIPYMNCWWLVVSDKRFVRPGELPDDWGLLAMRGAELAVVRPAPKRDAKPMPASRLAALLRAVAQTAAVRERREHKQRHRCHSGDSKCTALEELAGFPPERLAELVMCDCTQVPELGPCEHQRAIKTAAAEQGAV